MGNEETKRYAIVWRTAAMVLALVFLVNMGLTAQAEYAEEAWESGKLGDTWGLDVVDIDGDGSLEILAATVDNNISVYSAAEFSFERNILVSESEIFSYLYNLIEVGQLDSDASLELVAGRVGSLLTGFSVVDVDTGTIEWEEDNWGINDIVLYDVDSDGMDEMILGTEPIEIYNANDHSLYAESANLSGSVIAMKVADLMANGNKELVVITNEYSIDDNYNTNASGRLYVFALPSLNILVNKSIGNYLKCLDVADMDGDGQKEIIVGDGQMILNTLDYVGHIRIYDSEGNPEWESMDLGRIIENIVTDDVDGDGNMEFVIASDKIEIWGAVNKTTMWETSTLFSVGEDGALIVKDINGDGVKEIVTRASSYTAGNRILVYRISVPEEAPPDNTDDTTNTTTTVDDGAEEESQPTPGLDIYLIVAGIAAAAVIARVNKGRKK